MLRTITSIYLVVFMCVSYEQFVNAKAEVTLRNISSFLDYVYLFDVFRRKLWDHVIQFFALILK